MTLRKKTLLLVAITLIGLISLLYFASRAILLSSFIDLETSLVDRNIMRIDNAVQDDLDGLLLSVKDWAYWDDTYQYVQDGNSTYVEENLADSTFTHFRLNVVMFINGDGGLVYGQGFDSQERSGAWLLASMIEMLERRDPLFNYVFEPSPNLALDSSGTTGIIRLPEGPLLIATAPILTTDIQGPTAGMLLWGRFLGETELARLSELTRVSVTLHLISDENLPVDYGMAREHLTNGNLRYVQALDEFRVAGYSLINDVYGNPALIMRVASAREVYQRGQSALSYVLVSLLVAGVVVMLVTALMLERLILSRVAWLSRGVSQIESSGDLSMDVVVSGSDELSYLSERISRTFQSLRRSQEKIQESEARYAGIFRHSLDAIFLLKVLPNNRFEYETMNPADERGLGLTAEQIAGKTAHDLFEPETAKTKEYHYRRVVETGEPLEYKINYNINGDPQIWHNILVPIRDASGQIVRILGTARDISEQERAESHLRRQALVFENMSDAVIITNMQGRIIDWNLSAEQTFGYMRSEVLGMPLDLVKKTNDGLELTTRVFEAIKRDGRWQGEMVIVRKDGTERLMESVVVPLFDGDGNLIAAIGMNRDITERKRAEAEIIHKSDALAKFSDNLKTLHRITLTNYDYIDGMFGDYLRAGCEILGLPLGILGEVSDDSYKVWRVYSSDGDDRIKPGDRLLISETYCHETVRQRRTMTYTHVGQMPEMAQHPEYVTFGTETYIGAPIFVHDAVYGTLVFSSTEPRAEAFTAAEIEIIELMALGIGRSVELSMLEKERERAEFALREANSTFQALIEASPLAIVVFNAEGIVNLWNPAAERIFGWRAEEAVGKPPVYVQPDKADEFNQLLTTILSGKSMSNVELRRQRSDGSLIDISISSAPLRAVDGRIYGIMSVMDDVTERKQAKQQELELTLERERVRLIADFVRDASHDFRTPLSNIRTSAYLLERSHDAEQRRRRVDVIDEQVNQIDQLVDSLLTITRLNSGVEFAFRLIDLNELLQQVLVKMRPSAERKNLTPTLELSEVSPVNADESYIYQALVNLVQNAVDYTDDDGKVTVRTFVKDDEVVVEVNDTGVGIAPDDLPFILDRVYRTDRSWSAVGRPGLGLPIAKKIIEGHKGHIEVTSTPKKGSQFRVYIPAVPEVVRPN